MEAVYRAYNQHDREIVMIASHIDSLERVTKDIRDLMSIHKDIVRVTVDIEL